MKDSSNHCNQSEITVTIYLPSVGRFYSKLNLNNINRPAWRVWNVTNGSKLSNGVYLSLESTVSRCLNEYRASICISAGTGMCWRRSPLAETFRLE